MEILALPDTDSKNKGSHKSIIGLKLPDYWEHILMEKYVFLWYFPNCTCFLKLFNLCINEFYHLIAQLIVFQLKLWYILNER